MTAHEKDVLKRAMELREQKTTYDKIAVVLHSEGFKRPDGEPWSPSQINAMVRKAYPDQRVYKEYGRPRGTVQASAAEAIRRHAAERPVPVPSSIDDLFRKKAAEYILKTSHPDRADLAEIIMQKENP